MKTLREIFSEPTGKLSFTRITSSIILTAFLFSYIWIFLHEHKIVDIPTNIMFLLTGLYGINRIGSGIENFVKGRNGGESERTTQTRQEVR